MSFPTEGLAADLLERVLTKLGLSAQPAPTLDGLQTLYAAWCHKVPFDNVRKRLHRYRHDPASLPGDEATDFFAAWLAYGTGGTCWAGNGALQALLVALGFPASRGLGTMLLAPHLPPNHGTVTVACDGARYVVDASILHGAPLRLDPTAPTGVTHPAWGVQCGPREGHWHIRFRPVHMPQGLECRLDHLEATRDDFREHHEHTRRWSLFNYELYARLNCGERVVGLADGQRVEFDGTGGVTRRHLAGEDRLRVLVDELGMHEAIVRQLPPDTPTPPPPWSRNARVSAERADR